MSKKIVALVLCLLMLLPVLGSCGGKSDDNGPYIVMYLTNEVYDFDPANAYRNTETAQIVSMLFDTLFTLDANGKVQKSLVESYEVYEDEENNEYYAEFKLKTTCWSNGTRLSADDVVYAWKRLLSSKNNFEAAALLFDIKNARAVKSGDVSIDDLGISAESATIVKVIFEDKINVDSFIYNLTSVATAPLLENYVEKNEDWAKKSSTMVSSGPFKVSKIKFEVVQAPNDKGKMSDVQVVDPYAMVDATALKEKTYSEFTVKRQKISYFTLDRNTYYMCDSDDDDAKPPVTPVKLLVDCSKTAEQIWEDYQNDRLFYIFDIPMALRSNEDVLNAATVTDSLSTFVCYLNMDAEIVNSSTKEPEKLFANPAVRKALSMALDRTAMADSIVFADPATALVSPGVTDANGKNFRDVASDLISATADMDGAKKLLSDAGITPANYTFNVNLAVNDAEHLKMANAIVAAWKNLGFKVKRVDAYTVENDDWNNEVDDIPKDICDDQLTDKFVHDDFHVIAMDYVAYSADAYSMLANFATSFSGMALSMTLNEERQYEYTYHCNRSGYQSEKYNQIIDAIFYLPYFAALDRETDESFLGIYENKEEFQAAYDAVKAVYDEFGITPSTKSSDWSRQKSALMVEAEKVLMDDMAIIPVVFNKTATVTNKKLTNVKGTYYTPLGFQKAQLKGYKDYYFEDPVTKKQTTIFANFPAIDWDK